MSDIIININEQPNLGETKMLNSIATRPVAAYQSINPTIMRSNDYGLVEDCTFIQSLSTDIEGAVELALGIQRAGKAAWQLAPGANSIYLNINITAQFDIRNEVNIKSIGLANVLAPDTTQGWSLLGSCDSGAVTSSDKPVLSANFTVLLQQGYQTNGFSIVANAQNPAQILEKYTILISAL